MEKTKKIYFVGVPLVLTEVDNLSLDNMVSHDVGGTMGIVRDVFGYLMGLAFCAAAMVLCWLAWLGLEDMFGWRWALGGVVVSLLMRINFPVIVGLYFYAYNIMGWPQPQAFAFALPGLLILLPGIAVEVFGLLVGTAARR